jgi:alkylation response protein AidB-like acyl-CoA dehydrogenase
MIDFSINTEQNKLQEEVFEFTQANSDILDLNKVGISDIRTKWMTAGTLKIQGLCIPSEYGGRGLNAISTVLALEALGYGCEDNGFNFSVAAHLLACLMPIYLFGSEKQKQEFLPNLCNGKLIAANAMTEPSSGSDVYNLKTRALKEENVFRLNGFKNYVSNGPIADVLITYALTNPGKGFFGGISAFLINKKIHDYNVSAPVEKMGLVSCLMGEVHFEDLFVESSTLLGKEGGGAMIFNKSMEWERICLGALHLGTMKRLLEQAVDFAKARKSGGKNIGSYQAISHPLANFKARLEGARLLTLNAAWKLDRCESVINDAAICKLSVSETYKDLTIFLTQLYAGQAYRKGHPIEYQLRDAMASTIYSGTSEIQRNIIARNLGLK